MSKEKRFWVRCDENQHNQIKEIAEKENLSMGDLALCKILNLVSTEVEEVKEYTQTKTLKSGKKEDYTSRYITTKTILQPAPLAPVGNACPSCRLPVVYSNPRIQAGFDGKSSQIIFSTGCKCKEKALTLGEITERLNKE